MKWYEKDGNIFPGVILSSRVRLARNLKAYSFPNHIGEEQDKQVIQEVKQVFSDSKNHPLNYISMKALSSMDQIVLMEQHLISPLFVNERIERGILVSEDDSVSVMVNEEDHIRIQAVTAGADLNQVYEQANEIDDLIEDQLDYAYDLNLGYLTACPTNVGTGMRASYIVHVPALEASGQLRIILEAISKFGITCRGIYGESSESVGSILQLSNQVTLGFTEKEIIDNLNSVTMQIVDQELAVREKLLTEKRLEFEDTIYRAYGLLSYARVLSASEAMSLLSDIKLGLELGIIRSSQSMKLNIFKLMTMIQPASLQKAEGRNLDNRERDVVRANIIRQTIQKL
jgi:protein arginine kinase